MQCVFFYLLRLIFLVECHISSNIYIKSNSNNTALPTKWMHGSNPNRGWREGFLYHLFLHHATLKPDLVRSVGLSTAEWSVPWCCNRVGFWFWPPNTCTTDRKVNVLCTSPWPAREKRDRTKSFSWNCAPKRLRRPISFFFTPPPPFSLGCSYPQTMSPVHHERLSPCGDCLCLRCL